MTLSDIQNRITYITGQNTTNFSNTDRLIAINQAYDDIHITILQSQDEWDFDDKNNTTDFAILTTNLIAGQQDYSLPLDAMKVKRMEISYDGTNWQKANPIDFDEMTDPTDVTTIRNNFNVSEPFYGIFNNSFFLYPIPTQAVSAGLKIWEDRNANAFTSAELTAGTKSPGFDRQFHDLIPLKVAYDWVSDKDENFSKADRIDKRIKEMEEKLKRFYGSKQVDRRYQAVSSIVDYS